MSDGFALFERIFSFEWNNSITAVAAAMEPSEIYIVTKALSLIKPGLIPGVQIGFVFLILFISVLVLSGKKACEIAECDKYRFGFVFSVGFVFVWSVLSLSGVSSFVYFNF